MFQSSSPDGSRLLGAEVRVGNCGYIPPDDNLDTIVLNDLDNNVPCGIPVTDDDEDLQLSTGMTDDNRLYRECPTNTYGNVVYVTIDTATALKICDIEIYGVKRK